MAPGEYCDLHLSIIGNMYLVHSKGSVNVFKFYHILYINAKVGSTHNTSEFQFCADGSSCSLGRVKSALYSVRDL